MNFIVVIHPNGDIYKADQNDFNYSNLMQQIRAKDPTFSPYSDDSPNTYYDVIGSSFHTRFNVSSTTSTTTTTTTK